MSGRALAENGETAVHDAADTVSGEELKQAIRAAYEHAMGLLKPHFREGESGGTPYSRIRIKERRAMADASNRLRDALIETRRAIGV